MKFESQFLLVLYFATTNRKAPKLGKIRVSFVTEKVLFQIRYTFRFLCFYVTNFPLFQWDYFYTHYFLHGMDFLHQHFYVTFPLFDVWLVLTTVLNKFCTNLWMIFWNDFWTIFWTLFTHFLNKLLNRIVERFFGQFLWIIFLNNF